MTRTVKIASAVGALALASVAVPAGVSFAATDRAPDVADRAAAAGGSDANSATGSASGAVGGSSAGSVANSDAGSATGSASGSPSGSATGSPGGSASGSSSGSATTQEESFLGAEPLVPDAIQAPAGNVVHAVLKARGVQVYECKRGMWQPLEPAASLTGVTMSPVKKVTAVHFRGPAWVSDQDGSMVEGTDPVTAPAREAASVPQVLFKATGNRGGGLFGPVTWIQRLDPHGGAAPTTSCGGDQPIAVPYRAVYRFFTKK
ncbi:DUF3455 domain-containing protein [Actinoplanes oblitus]|uniref:DUF3455 domain-containing protein n=1 Tax=Actinoplanes oblitus TaxID=3040509 RepID=A0ABY8WBQ3_9ACTN|nr:DUF3455 domain-containing protein [Actinoplanes oblitus]WIM93898.1 DUF3455 domain-containing protein [Actinoplanes oblitus]